MSRPLVEGGVGYLVLAGKCEVAVSTSATIEVYFHHMLIEVYYPQMVIEVYYCSLP